MSIFSHLSKEYINHCKKYNINTDNGAFYYAKELYDNVIPNIKTQRNWVLLNIPDCCWDNSIVFIHNNKNPERYEWLKQFKNLIVVCSNFKTLKFMIDLLPKTHCIYIPLSIDIKYVEQFQSKRKTKKLGYYGRLEKCPEEILNDDGIDKIFGPDREKNLKLLSKYKDVYAIGRCAIEAKCLKCNVIHHAGEYNNISFDLIDNSEIIPELQRLINEIDGVK